MSMSSKAFVPYQNGVLYKENKGGKPSAVRCVGGKLSTVYPLPSPYYKHRDNGSFQSETVSD